MSLPCPAGWTVFVLVIRDGLRNFCFSGNRPPKCGLVCCSFCTQPTGICKNGGDDRPHTTGRALHVDLVHTSVEEELEGRNDWSAWEVVE